jgi:hypothetical protein
MLTQIGIWVAAAGLVGTGLYFYLQSDEPTVLPSPSADQMAEAEKQNEAEPVELEPEATGVESEIDAQPQEAPEAQNTKPESNTPAERNTKVAKPQAEIANDEALRDKEIAPKPVAPATLDVFDPTEEMEKSKNAEEAGPTDEKEPSKAPSIVVETANDKRYNFHYQFKNEKLYLYGAFERNLYEIMEFFSDNKRTMFLYYKDNYYLLNEENDRVKALTPITDTALLKKLKDYRGK